MRSTSIRDWYTNYCAGEAPKSRYHDITNVNLGKKDSIVGDWNVKVCDFNGNDLRIKIVFKGTC